MSDEKISPDAKWHVMETSNLGTSIDGLVIAGEEPLGRTPVEVIRERIASLRAEQSRMLAGSGDFGRFAADLDTREIMGLELALRALGVES